MSEAQVIGVEAAEVALAALVSELIKDAPAELGAFAVDEADRLRSAADTKQARMVASGITSRKTSQYGEVDAVGEGSPAASDGTFADVFFGAEFGGSQPQFRPYRATGYWFFPTLEADADTELDTIADHLLDAAAKRWAD